MGEDGVRNRWRERRGDDVEATIDYLERQKTVGSKVLGLEHVEN